MDHDHSRNSINSKNALFSLMDMFSNHLQEILSERTLKNDFNNISQPLEQMNESLSKVQCKLKRNAKSISC